MVDEEPEAKPAKSSLIRRLLPGRSSAQDPHGEDLGDF
jgi:hypothetical protein